MTPDPDLAVGGGASAAPRARPEVETDPDVARLIVESVVDYAIFMLDLDGRVVSWNAGAQRLKQYTADEILGRHFSVFYPAAARKAGIPQRELEEAIAAGRVEDEGWRVRRDGSEFWANVVITALRSHDGVLRGFGKVTRDLTERKRAEDVLLGVLQREREAAQGLREADRSKQDLVAIVAHDLRAPIGIVQGTADVLLQDWERLTDESRRAMLRQIASSSNRLSSLVEDVLDVARIEADQLQYKLGPVDLVTVVERVVADVDPAGQRIVVTRPEGEVLVRADEQRVWQILMNLVGNALKFSAAGDSVGIAVAADADAGCVAVTDHGPGIAEADKDRLFQRFSRIPARKGFPPPGGTGLGLFIARSLVIAQGGRISVESRPGEGATFRFALPGAGTPS